MKTILVIANDDSLRECLVTRLSLANFRVLDTGDGVSGLQMVEESRPDLVICDLMIPALNGFGVLSAIRQNPPVSDTAFLLMTGKTEYEIYAQAQQLRANGCLKKPKLWKQLLPTIAACLTD